MNKKVFTTHRKDKWWIEPTITALGFLCFVIYTTWRALSGVDFHYENYLSPFYSPLLFENPLGEGMGHSWFGAWPKSIPSWIPASPQYWATISPFYCCRNCATPQATPLLVDGMPNNSALLPLPPILLQTPYQNLLFPFGPKDDRPIVASLRREALGNLGGLQEEPSVSSREIHPPHYPSLVDS